MELKGFFADSNIFVKLVLTAFFTVFGLVLGSVFAGVIFSAYGISSTDMVYLLEHHLTAVKISQLIQSIFGFIMPALAMGYLTSKEPCRFLALQQKPNGMLSLSTIVVMLLAVPVINFMVDMNARINLPDFMSGVENWMKESEAIRTTINEKFLATSTVTGLLMNILLVAVVPAISEELFFRGLLQKYFLQGTKNIHLAIWITAIIFSAFHMQFYGFIPRMVLGAYFGYLLVWSRSLWVPVIAHFVSNAATVIMYFLYQNKIVDYNFDEFGIKSTLFVTAINVVLIGFIVYWQRKKSVIKNNL